MTKKLADGKVITCPAGEPAKAGCGVFCKIEGAILMQGTDKQADNTSVRVFCTGSLSEGDGHPKCPTWQYANQLNMTQQEASQAVQRAHDTGVDLDNEVLEELGAL